MTTIAPEILLLSLGNRSSRADVEQVHGSLLHSLDSRSNVSWAFTARETFEHLDREAPPRGILIANPTIVHPEYDELSTKLVAYVRKGGIVIHGGFFSTDIRPDDLGTYMQAKWDLPWKAGSYYRTTLYLNQEAIPRSTTGLLSSYNQKAVFLEGVNPDVAWYVISDRSVVESLAPGSEINILETPVAFARAGDGWIGYLGDVNGEVGTVAVILKMFGLT
ncbi:uncharacterized protein B0I36DRAFT_256882 [Microdochium trichocladiopsis]|uniref:Uncharacterized protein n=1 Tax=Microdochium trichocladiopsis TaxID=1682393 RepID=A0A9P9BFE3_9PEZI|nr:uncharacterized protein B0I36DRAFT_256882 [Microdochium trichocladiopsis]KAH7012030.1 hypothetical protein B0I36DRAFT_256882 [Microdochium trichocladiopsis]